MHTIYIRDMSKFRNSDGKDEYQHSGLDDLKWKDVNHKESIFNVRTNAGSIGTTISSKNI